MKTQEVNQKQFQQLAVNEVKDNLPLISNIQEYWQEVKNEIIKI